MKKFTLQTSNSGLLGSSNAIILAAMLLAGRGLAAEHHVESRGGATPRVENRGPENRGGWVDRSSHGSVRHYDSHVYQRPAEVHRDFRTHEVVPRHDVFVHRDVDVDFHRPHFWNDFVFGRHLAALPFGFLTLNIGGAPYYYSDGIYYQPSAGGYQEVYPPVGADVPQPPDGAISVDAGGQTYYYAGGAFYLQQPDGTYAIAPTPLGVVVPELPPGAVQVSAGGQIAYQFSGIYYRPVFVNGVTQYQTFQP
jgi:hypothetical protein